MELRPRRSFSGIDRFLNGTFAGVYQQELLAEFANYLPERPPWPVVE